MLAPLRSRETAPTVGIGCLVRLIAVFAARISPHNRMLLSCLGTITTGETQSVGVSSGIFSMIYILALIFVSHFRLCGVNEMVFVAVAVQQEILCCQWLNQPVDSLVFPIHETRVRVYSK